ncbi:MAG: hypothetical protein M1837_005581 [Sclerophora amabilis]|nr:MAG: hypothetical protein M1837_005581 [Sclerophora amabilis]
MASSKAVVSLYRRSLKLALDWSVHRHLWRGQAVYIRGLFDANRHIQDPRQQRVHSQSPFQSPLRYKGADFWMQVLFQETEDLLEKWKHPDPYCAPTAPGGSKYERNLQAPILDPPPHMTL